MPEVTQQVSRRVGTILVHPGMGSGEVSLGPRAPWNKGCKDVGQPRVLRKEATCGTIPLCLRLQSSSLRFFGEWTVPLCIRKAAHPLVSRQRQDFSPPWTPAWHKGF